MRLQSPQAGLSYSGTLDCISKTIKNEGFSAFYKGTMSPLVGIAFCVSIQFATLEEMKRVFTQLNGGQSVSPSQFYLAGGIAGVANSVVSGPVEHIRTRMQVQTSLEYKSTLDCFKKIYSEHGLRGIYKGQPVTMIREFLGYGGYFFAYETLVQNAVSKVSGMKVSDLPTWKVMLFGAGAGYAMW